MKRSQVTLAALAVTSLVLAGAAAGCLSDTSGDAAADGGTTNPVDGGGNNPLVDSSIPIDPDAEVGDPTKNDAIADSTENITYRDDLTKHVGCTTANLDTRVSIDGKPASYTAAVLPDFTCAAKEYPIPAGEDTTRPIIILVHGNSSTPNDWETNADDPADPKTKMISETLVADGWHVYAADFRYDKVDDPTDQNTGNPAKNMDHGWTTPILESLIRSVHKKYPTRKINLSGFSLGTTVIRDALRRMHHRGEKPFEFVHALHLVSGANHGVAGYTTTCGDPKNPTTKTMRSYVACQMGNRDNYATTPFATPLNGAANAWETPCADGFNAYGQQNVCGGNKVLYTTAVFADPADGPLQDEFVSEKAAALTGAENKTVKTLDTTNYFLNGIFKHHYGAIRSAEGIAIAKAALER